MSRALVLSVIDDALEMHSPYLMDDATRDIILTYHRGLKSHIARLDMARHNRCMNVAGLSSGLQRRIEALIERERDAQIVDADIPL